MHKVAVITRTRERQILLERALASVSGQTMRDLLWVIVNDGGETGPVDAVADRARASGVATSVVHRAESSGMEAASNAGIRASQSAYVTIHDDDDSWDPGFLAATCGFLDRNAQFGGVISHARRITEELAGRQVRLLASEPHMPLLQAVHLADMARSNLYPPICFLFRRPLYEAVGGYDESMAIFGDWDFNLRFLLKADIGVIPEPLANYHLRGGKGRQKGGHYANSIRPQDTRQLIADSAYRNRLIRGDIESGRFGLGSLLFMASLGVDADRSASLRRRLRTWLRKRFS